MKVLFILSRFPYPLEKGDKLRAYHQIRTLSAKHEIFLFAISDKRVEDWQVREMQKYCKAVNVFRLTFPSIIINICLTFFNKLPFQSGYFYSALAKRQLDAWIDAIKPALIIFQLIRTAAYSKNVKGTTLTLDYMDALSKGVERRIASVSPFLRPLFRMEYRRLLKYESAVAVEFDNLLIISKQDKELIPVNNERIEVIKNGVDLTYFKHIDCEDEYDILFNGNMSYPPNIEGAEFLVKKIIPLVKEKIPSLKVLISGANPSARVKALGDQDVTISGWSEDIRQNFAKSKMLVAPMFYGSGLQNKLLEAMAMQKPCITSNLANNALGAIDGESILIADTPEEYAEHIILLLSDKAMREKIAKNGYRFVAQNYSWEKETEKLETLLVSSMKSNNK